MLKPTPRPEVIAKFTKLLGADFAARLEAITTSEYDKGVFVAETFSEVSGDNLDNAMAVVFGRY